MSSKWFNFLLAVFNNSVDSVTIKNKDGNPQLIVTPKGAAKELVEAVQKVIEENDET